MRTGGRRTAPAAYAPALALAVSLAVALPGCAARAEPPAPVGGVSAPASPTAAAEPTEVPEARVGRPAKSERVHFVPEQVRLPGRATAKVVPAATVDGVLKVPENVRHVGWWDGSAYAGDPFGSTVIAGHVDSATEGVGFFARLESLEVGDRVVVSAGRHAQPYRIVAVTTVSRKALASDSRAFDQTGGHRLVLITCTGVYRRDRGGYDRNLVVIAKPIGLAR